MTLDLKLGDPWPFKSSRGLTGRPMETKWFALVVAPQREARVAKQLSNAGVTVEYPTEQVIRHRSGKRIERVKPMISRIIYAKFDFAPQWDVLKQRRIITGVFCRGVSPVVVADPIVREICRLPEVEDEMERERIAALTPDVGEQVQLRGGLFDGFRVDVIRSEYGRVWYQAVTDIGSMQGEASVEDILRLALAS